MAEPRALEGGPLHGEGAELPAVDALGSHLLLSRVGGEWHAYASDEFRSVGGLTYCGTVVALPLLRND